MTPIDMSEVPTPKEFKDYLDKENAPDGEWRGLWWIPEELFANLAD